MKKTFALLILALLLPLCACGKSPEPEPTEEIIITPTPVTETEVRLRNDPLPEGFVLLDYAACHNSTQDSQTYIDTGLSPTNNTRFYLDFECTSGFEVKDTWFFGCFDRDRHMFVEVGYHMSQGNEANFYTCTGIQYSQYEDSAARTVAWMRPEDYNCPDFLLGTYHPDFIEPIKQHLFLFSRQHMYMNVAGTEEVIQDYDLRIYTCRIWDEDVLLRDYVACRSVEDGRIGMYELVDGRVYYSDGSDELLPGEELMPDSSATALNGKLEDMEVPVLEGFIFEGYYTGFGGSGEQIIGADGKVCAEISTEEGQTLYAHWTRDDAWFDRY